MTVSLQLIAQYLVRRGWHYDYDAECDQIITGVKCWNLDRMPLLIRVSNGGYYFQIFAPHIMAGVKGHPYQNQVLETLLVMGWEMKMVQWGYDRNDGEIRAEIGIPVADGTLTETQFSHCLDALIHVVDGVAIPRLRRVMQTGVDYQSEMLDEQMLLQLEQEAPGLLSRLEQALVRRRKRLDP